ncbi:MAG: hypothetical protein VX700_06150 [Pseudomonadota bacterium]|nr:hypothetical protein [Pseudomonadota bacterium]
MIEVMIERWSQRDGSTEWLWSIWQDGERKHMGGAHVDADTAEKDARAACRQMYGKIPDDITIL